MSVTTPTRVQTRPIDVGATLAWFRHGQLDPTTRLERSRAGGGGTFVRATHTPDGPAVLTIRWASMVTSPDEIDVSATGPGAAWSTERAPAMVGFDDLVDHGLDRCAEPAVAAAARSGASWRLGASGDLYHELLPTIIEQRITSREAHRQWRSLCERLGSPAPGSHDDLLLPPDPARLASQPSWWFHPLGIERRRAEALTRVARHADRLWAWAVAGPEVARQKLALIPGVGVWTVGSVLGPALGDADAVAVGDYHLKNVVAWAMRGEPRATDDRMLELLAPFAGQRGRVAALLARSVGGAPKFGPRQRILPMYAW